MKLTQDQQDLLDGKFGEGAKLAMKVQVAIGESFGAERMVPITRAHVALSNQDADRWLAEKLAGLGAKCRVRPTVNPGFCLSYFKKMGVVTNKDYEEMERTDRAYRALGAELSYNCTPYMDTNVPLFGEICAFSESSATPYVNSIWGARSNREGANSALFASITGYVPEYGLLLDENRHGNILVQVEADIKCDADYHILGMCGKKIGHGIPVFAGLPKNITKEALRNLGAELNTSGSYDMYHIPGFTPEAPDIKTAFGGKEPERVVTITNDSMRNAIKVCLAMSGSTNAVMHLTAIAHEAELSINVLQEFDSLSDTTPQVAKINPASKYNMTDFYHDGGVYRMMKEMKSILATNVMTVTGMTLGETIDNHKFMFPHSHNVIHTLKDPFGYTGGVAVLKGNLAPDTGITKPGAFDPSLHHFVGEAICFDSEELAEEAILAGKVHEGHVVVIRYEGPKGGPGMREMFKAMKYLYGRGLALTTALITDGRFSGTNNGCFVGHISPEAAEGGPIAIVHDGDKIEIDVDNKKLNLLVSDEEIKNRLEKWVRPEPKFKKGWLGLYCKIAASGSEGAILKFDKLK